MAGKKKSKKKPGRKKSGRKARKKSQAEIDAELVAVNIDQLIGVAEATSTPLVIATPGFMHVCGSLSDGVALCAGALNINTFEVLDELEKAHKQIGRDAKRIQKLNEQLVDAVKRTEHKWKEKARREREKGFRKIKTGPLKGKVVKR